MAWCENQDCLKDNLCKADVEFCGVTHKVLCHSCYEKIGVSGVYLPTVDPKIGFAIQISDSEGIKAKLSYGDAAITFQAPSTELKRLFGI